MKKLLLTLLIVAAAPSMADEYAVAGELHGTYLACAKADSDNAKDFNKKAAALKVTNMATANNKQESEFNAASRKASRSSGFALKAKCKAL
ncbi:hypothetical protein BIZ37_26315 [Photobacterium sp. BZF1]|uniref:hypothetical protein n=1 Tax=Photobacterium sp. BZF1 TaxID=1904457 RepID=UPI0016539BF4|nr:hypothetical protein [Photobacterium sp. BZF1]MBC7006078.1 hypothetical protein [Photobacterium sp. BZF1]